MNINGREIGPDHPPYIVAEISGNHCGSFERCCFLMGLAIGAGADAVKIQSYTPNSITIDSDLPEFIIKDGPWKGRKLYELYQSAHTPREWLPELFRLSKRYGYTLFSSVFSPEEVDLLETLECPAYKIASMEIVDIPLISYAAKTGKPIIISTGMAHRGEIDAAISVVGPLCDNVLALHCVSGYPTRVDEANLHRLVDFNNDYHVAGISDHSPGGDVPIAATALGAVLIEKHFTDTRKNGSEDAEFSMEPHEFREMVKSVKAVWQAMQPSDRKVEESSRQLRRSLYVVQDIRRGERFTVHNLRSIRPAGGAAPKHLPWALGKVANCDILRGTPLNLHMVSDGL